MSAEFAVGDTVTVNSPGHRQDGATGQVVYLSRFWGTIGVRIDGNDYGFLPPELTTATPKD